MFDVDSFQSSQIECMYFFCTKNNPGMLGERFVENSNIKYDVTPTCTNTLSKYIGHLCTTPIKRADKTCSAGIYFEPLP